MNKNYKVTALIGLRNNSPKLPTGNYYQYIFVTRNLAVAKNSLYSRYPNHTISVLLELPSIMSDSELNQMRMKEEKANYIIRNKQRQTKFEIKQTQLQQFYYSDKAEFTKYLNNLKTRIECDWENNKFYLNKKIGGIWTHSNKDEISFRKLTEICIEQERKKLVVIDNQQDINKDREIENLKKQNQELIKKIELMNNIELENEIIQLKQEIKKLKSQLNSVKEQPISSAAKSDKSDKSDNPINSIKPDITKIEVKCHDDDLFNDIFADEEEKIEDNKSQFPTSTDNGISTPKAANVSNNDFTNNVITNNANTNNSNQIEQSQKIPNIQRFRGSSNPYKQDITDDELYALAAAL